MSPGIQVTWIGWTVVPRVVHSQTLDLDMDSSATV